MHTRAFAHLPIVLHCYDVIIFLGRKVVQIENNGLGGWLNANPYGQSGIRIFRIEQLKNIQIKNIHSILLDQIKNFFQNNLMVKLHNIALSLYYKIAQLTIETIVQNVVVYSL